MGIEASFLSSLGYLNIKNRVDHNKQNHLIASAVLEQNYKWFNYGFNFGTGVGYYFGIQDLIENSIGMITNIGWFPIYKGKNITPYITYRNDWVFNDNKINMQSISIGLNF